MRSDFKHRTSQRKETCIYCIGILSNNALSYSKDSRVNETSNTFSGRRTPFHWLGLSHTTDPRQPSGLRRLTEGLLAHPGTHVGPADLADSPKDSLPHPVATQSS